MLSRNRLAPSLTIDLEPRIQLAAALGGDSQFDVDVTYVNPQLIDSTPGNDEQAAIETAMKIFHGLIVSGPITTGTVQIAEGADNDSNLATQNSYVFTQDVGALNAGRSGTITLGRLVETSAVLPLEVLHNLLHLAGVGNSGNSNDVMFTRNGNNINAALQAQITQATADRLTQLGYTVNSNFVGKSLRELIQQVGGTVPASPASSSTNSPPTSVPTSSNRDTTELGGDSQFDYRYHIAGGDIDSGEFQAFDTAFRILNALVVDSTRFDSASLGINQTPLQGNVLGIARLFDFDGTIRVDTGISQSTLTYVTIHEALHAMGIRHVDNASDVMYPSVRGLGAAITESTASRLRNLGYTLDESLVGVPLRTLVERFSTSSDTSSEQLLLSSLGLGNTEADTADQLAMLPVTSEEGWLTDDAQGDGGACHCEICSGRFLQRISSNS